MRILNTPVLDNTHPHRHFCIELEDVAFQHRDPTITKGIGSDWLVGIWQGKKLILDDKDGFKVGNPSSIVGAEIQTFDIEEVIQDTSFLLYDAAGLNYAHFFFDMFSRCLYYDELRKSNPQLQIVIPEDYYSEAGNSTFVKEWLDLYYKNNPPVIKVLQKGVGYKINKVIIPGAMYTFPEPFGDRFVISKIRETIAAIPPIETKSEGCYISRQDTKKRGWYHSRDLVNELELIEQIKGKLNYDIIELMDYNMIEKIQIFKSYKTIIQQSSASNISAIFSNPGTNTVIISNPRMGWLSYKLQQFSDMIGFNLYTLEDVGRYLSEELNPNQIDKDNYPWELVDVEGVVELLEQIKQL